MYEIIIMAQAIASLQHHRTKYGPTRMPCKCSYCASRQSFNYRCVYCGAPLTENVVRVEPKKPMTALSY